MLFQVVGVKRIVGIAKASGNPFDMCRLYALVPIESGAGKITVTGSGFEVGEMDLDPDAMPAFAAVTLPARLELKTEQAFRMGEFRTVVTGFEPIKSAVKAA
jgi:hypothetical protein